MTRNGPIRMIAPGMGNARAAGITGSTITSPAGHGFGRIAAVTVAVTALTAGVAIPSPAFADASASGSGPAATAVPSYDHIVVVVEENHAYEQVTSQPFLSSLIAGGASFTNAHAETHPSQPNYLDLWAGQDYGVTDDACTTLSGDNLGAQVLAAGQTVRGYAEDLPAAGSTACRAGAYAKKHNPIATFTQTAGTATNLPLTAFPEEYARLPRLAYVLPNLDHDMHDGSVQAGDGWLQRHLGGYAAWAATHNSLLLVTFDEDDGRPGNTILNVLYGAHVTAGSYAAPITHYSDLATIEAGLGLPALTDTSPIAGAFDTTGQPTCSTTIGQTTGPSAASPTPAPGPGPGAGAQPPGGAPSAASASPTAGSASPARTASFARALSVGGPLGAGTYSFADFTARTNGVDLPAAGLTGAGVDRTVVAMTPHTSTKGRTVPTTAYATNQLSLLEATGRGPRLSGFTLEATDQGHQYNGLRLERATDARVTDVKVAAVPGSTNYPPGETFGINDFRTTGSVYCGLQIDGAGLGAAGFGANDSIDLTIRDAVSHDNPHSHGFTFWQSRDITLIDVTSADNWGGLNFERDSGTIRIVRPVLTAPTSRRDISVNSDITSAEVTITDPVLPASGKLRIFVSAKYHGKANQQKRSDIRVIIGGVDRTSDVVQWVG